MRTHFVYSFIADTQIVFKIELVCLFALLPFISAFFELITVDKISRVTKGYSLYSLLMVVAAIVTPINFNLDILRIWQVTGLIMILYIFFYLICWKFFSKASRRWKRQRTLKQSKSRIAVFFDALRETAVGNLFIGSTFLVGTAIFDILDSMIFQSDLVLTLGSTFIIANRFTFLNKQMYDLNYSLDKKIKAHDEDRYMDFLMDRQKEPIYYDKKVKIEASITSGKVMYRIGDDGPGFDHKTFLESTRHQVNETLAHGRGISMALQLFDKVSYPKFAKIIRKVKKYCFKPPVFIL